MTQSLPRALQGTSLIDGSPWGRKLYWLPMRVIPTGIERPKKSTNPPEKTPAPISYVFFDIAGQSKLAERLSTRRYHLIGVEANAGDAQGWVDGQTDYFASVLSQWASLHTDAVVLGGFRSPSSQGKPELRLLLRSSLIPRYTDSLLQKNYAHHPKFQTVLWAHAPAGATK